MPPPPRKLRPPQRRRRPSTLPRIDTPEEKRARWQNIITNIFPHHQIQDGLFNQVVSKKVTNLDGAKFTRFVVEHVLAELRKGNRWGTTTKKTYRGASRDMAPARLTPSTIVKPSPIGVYNSDVITMASVLGPDAGKIVIVIPTGCNHDESVGRWIKGQYKAVEQIVMAKSTLAASIGLSSEDSLLPIEMDEVLISKGVTVFATNTLKLLDYDHLFDVTLVSVVSKRRPTKGPWIAHEKQEMKRSYNNAIRAAFEEGAKTVILSPLSSVHNRHPVAEVAALLVEILMLPDQVYNWAFRELRFVIAIEECDPDFNKDSPWAVFRDNFFGKPGCFVDYDGMGLYKLVKEATLH